jgi:transcriptional regulator with XRE-family HTH domain
MAKSRTSPNEQLRRLRVDEKTLTLEELARRAGVSSQTLRKAERGQQVSEISKSKIAKALGVSAGKIFGGTEG